MKKIILFPFTSAVFLFTSYNSFAQNVSVNTNGALPNSTALLDIGNGTAAAGGDTKGLLIPRVALTSITDAVTISAPATSLIVYCSGTGGLSPAGYYYWNGAQWVRLIINGSNAGTEWLLAGNALTGGSAATPNEWIGASNDYDWIVKTNGSERMRVYSTTGGSGNVLFKNDIGVNNAAPTNAIGINITGAQSGWIGVNSVINGKTTDYSFYSSSVFDVNTNLALYTKFGFYADMASTNSNAGAFGINNTGIFGYAHGSGAGGTSTNIAAELKAASGTTNIAIRLDGSTSGTLDISPAAVTTSHGYIMPSTLGTANQVLTISSVAGSTGTLAWSNPGASSGSSSPYFNAGSQSISTLGSNTFNVPAGVTQIKIWMVGGGGGYGDFQATNGGWGGYVYGIIDVTPAEALTVFIGAAGTNGGAGVVGGGGGGSYILRNTGSVLLCQAGGGGGGSSCAITCADGDPGGKSFSGTYPSSGSSGTTSAGGAGGSNYIAQLREASAFSGGTNMPTPTAFGNNGYGQGGGNAGVSVKGFVFITW